MTDKQAHPSAEAMGNQALMNAVVRQRDVALQAQAQAEARCEVLFSANQTLAERVKELEEAQAKDIPLDAA
jgi:hypothetical protein